MAGPSAFVSVLREGAYRRLWCSGLCVNGARWMDLVLLGWLAFQLTDSPFMVGLAAFADVGAAADSFEAMQARPSVGLGLRTLIPQANRFVFRIDWGLPLAPEAGQSVFPGGFFASFGQAFSLPGIKPRTATTAVLD